MSSAKKKTDDASLHTDSGHVTSTAWLLKRKNSRIFCALSNTIDKRVQLATDAPFCPTSIKIFSRPVAIQGRVLKSDGILTRSIVDDFHD